jgi:RNA polymerase sigma factor (sigma-70 family)
MGMGDGVTEAEQDRALFDAWKGGDRAAYSQLFVRLEKIARKVASRYARFCDADDVSSEASVGVCEAIRDWHGDGALGAFAFFRAQSRVVDYVRRAAPSRRNTVSIYAYSSTEQIEEWRSEGMQERAVLVGEVRAIAEDVLPPKEIDVLALRALGMTGAAIARRKRVDRSQICRREKSAMEKLTDAVTDE